MPTHLVQHQFGVHANNYVTSRDLAAGESLDQLAAIVQPQPGWRALDVATGGGHTALAVGRSGARVVASDLTAPMLAAARKFLDGQAQTETRYEQSEAGALPYGADTFDLVTCRLAAHHFPDPAGFVREAARVTRPGGLVAVIDLTVPADPAAARHINAVEKLRDPGHHWCHTPADWLDFFAAAGLAVTHQAAFRKRFDFEPWAERMSVPPNVRQQLRVLFRHAPAAAFAALAPQASGDPATGPLTFDLTEILLIGRKSPTLPI